MQLRIACGVVAALQSLTRLPLWRIPACRVPAETYRDVVTYWPAVGWVTAPCMALTLWACRYIFPFSVCVCLALAARMLLTGAIHEDGLSDYMDGLGGRSRTQVLVIMKDSHAGTYGILALAVYLLTLFASLLALGETLAPIAVLVGDPLSKWISSWIALRLPYARKDGESKMGLAYQRPHRSAIIASATLGLIPLALLAGEPRNLLAALPPIAVFGGMVRAMRRRIGGYTGDCCGALFALCELSFYLGLLAVARVWSYI